MNDDIYRKGELDKLTYQMLQLGYEVEKTIPEIAEELGQTQQQIRRELIRAMRHVVSKARKENMLDGD